MEGIRHRAALARAALVVGAMLALAACSAAPARPNVTLTPTLAPSVTNSATATASPIATAVAPSDEIPDSPMTTKAIAISRPQRGSSAPVGAVVFGTDVTETGRNVTLVNERTSFPAGHNVAWRVTLDAATGGESVRVTLTTESDTETQVDDFVAQAGWNVYYGSSLLTVAPGTYVLHYLIDGHEVGSGTFKIKPSDAVPSVSPEPSPT